MKDHQGRKEKGRRTTKLIPGKDVMRLKCRAPDESFWTLRELKPAKQRDLGLEELEASQHKSSKRNIRLHDSRKRERGCSVGRN